MWAAAGGGHIWLKRAELDQRGRPHIGGAAAFHAQKGDGCGGTLMSDTASLARSYSFFWVSLTSCHDFSVISARFSSVVL
jgi:hypothetical protein